MKIETFNKAKEIQDKITELKTSNIYSFKANLEFPNSNWYPKLYLENGLLGTTTETLDSTSGLCIGMEKEFDKEIKNTLTVICNQIEVKINDLEREFYNLKDE